MLNKCDDTGTVLPKFVVDTYDGLPPTSGFDLVANSINSLMEELSILRNEVCILKKDRLEDDMRKQDHILFKEDLLIIKGELRKLNHRFIGNDIRRNSMMFESMEKSLQHINKQTFQGSDDDINDSKCDVQMSSDICGSPVIENDVLLSCTPSAPPASQETWGPLVRSFQDEGGPASAPSFIDIASEERMLQNQRNKRNHLPSKHLKNLHPRLSSDGLPNVAGGCPGGGGEERSRRLNNQVTDGDGFTLVQRNKRRKQNIVGSRKTDGNKTIKSAPRIADLYLGNCDLEVTPEDIRDYIASEMNIDIDKCEVLPNKNPKCKSFKISLNMNDRSKLLSSEAWPENIYCRKFYNASGHRNDKYS